MKFNLNKSIPRKNEHNLIRIKINTREFWVFADLLWVFKHDSNIASNVMQLYKLLYSLKTNKLANYQLN